MKAELQTRLTQFGKNLITTAQELTISIINRNTLERAIECGTNAGAEYTLANVATTKKSFSFRINMCKGQLQTAQYRLELLLDTTKDKKDKIKKLFAEAKELAIIFSKIARKIKKWEIKKDSEIAEDSEE